MTGVSRLALIIGAAALFAGCGAAQPPIGAPGGMPQAPASQSRQAPVVLVQNVKTSKSKLFIDDALHDAVEILKNGTWKNIGSITNGVYYPNANWVDRHGHLYVTNAYGSSDGVSEYSPSGSLKFTYNDNMVYPEAVTTDRNGNVYEADEFTGVNEYHQGSNTVVASCPQLGGGQRGIAVDAQGDVFASYSTGSMSGAVVEYIGGLAGCSGTTLGVAFGVPGGMDLDKNANLLVCDETNSTVAVLAPPYSQISGYLGSKYDIPVEVTLNRENAKAYVTAWGAEQVDVITYPAGKTVATLSWGNGLDQPTGAVDGSNYVP